jgi:NTP pyrophosphatase (non-canonical NTP hydrolase)
MRNRKELRIVIEKLSQLDEIEDLNVLKKALTSEIEALQYEMEDAPEDFMSHILESHRALCAVKNMGMKEAYGHDPFLYYTVAMAGEVGEICNKLVKGYRGGCNFKNAQEAVRTELPDAFIYGTILAYISDIDILDEINKKVEVVTKRAHEGYYGGPLNSEPDVSRIPSWKELDTGKETKSATSLLADYVVNNQKA